MTTKTILIDRKQMKGRVYASGLFMRLCEETSMEVGLVGNGVSYTGSINDMILGDKIVKEYQKEHGEAP